MNPIRIVIADDHPVFRAGLQGLLSGQADFQVVGEAANGREAVNSVRLTAPDVLLVDLQMPELDGVHAIREIRGVAPKTRILVLTTYDSDGDILRAVEAGATGYLLKDTPREELFKAIRATARGESVLAPTVASKLVGRARAPVDRSLSAREIEVLRLVARGTSNKIIGKELRISEATVKTHLLHIFAKLSVDDRTAAVTAAMERGVLRLEK
jgi:DNA-binding NarL/FixJ family response regulator